MDVVLDHRFAEELSEFTLESKPAPAPKPQVVIVNTDLAETLGIDPEWLPTEEGAKFLTGQLVAPGSQPVAQLYSGHQFGGFSPLLGDGRAILLGELTTPDGTVVDLHLKGSGPNKASRGDGFAALDAVLREFLVSEAMHALNIPTTRALAVTQTGRRHARDNFRHDGVLPGAVLTRVASSHIRVGTFQFARATGDVEILRRLTTFAMKRHDPDLLGTHDKNLNGMTEPQRVREFFGRVLQRQAEVTARWMLVGFVHGVMNTDNVLISGETIDYGPCAFIDVYDPAAVFSSIDQGARYAYGSQPSITKWNMARLADTLIPLFDDDPHKAVSIAEEELDSYDKFFNDAWVFGMRSKLGLADASLSGISDAIVGDVARELFGVMTAQRMDYTEAFRALISEAEISGSSYLSEIPALQKWLITWKQHHIDIDVMRSANPVVIPRNRHLQQAIDEALDGDFSLFTQLLEAVTDPFTDRPTQFAQSGNPGSAPFVTYCGT